MLKFKTKQMIDLQDWDDLVRSTYGKPYDFQQQDGCKERGTFEISIPDEHAWDYPNDTIPEEINGEEMGVSFKAWLARDVDEWNGDAEDKSFIKLFWYRNFYPDISMIANDLFEKGLIQAGEYVIDIDW